MKTDRDYTDPIAKEIVDLHIFFEDWFSGRCENTDQALQERLLCRMDDDFMIVLPGGVSVLGGSFWPEFRKLHGTNDDFKISIRNVDERGCSQGKLIIVTYEEWQMNAKYSDPPNNGRQSTAILIEDSSTPNGVRWAHVHETWLPGERINSEAFDW